MDVVRQVRPRDDGPNDPSCSNPDVPETRGDSAFWIGASQPETIAVPRSFMHCYLFAELSLDQCRSRRVWSRTFLPLTRNVIGNAHTLVVVAHGKNHYKTAASALRDLGFVSQLVGEWPIGYGSLETSMAMLRLTPNP